MSSSLKELVREIDRLVGSRQRSRFLIDAAQKLRRRQIEALTSAAGAWEDKNHPELREGSAKWIRQLRQEGERRLRKQSHR